MGTATNLPTIRLICIGMRHAFFAFPSTHFYIDRERMQRNLMTKSRMRLSTPRVFDFLRTIYSHGWCSLPPFEVNKSDGSLTLAVRLREGVLALCVLRGATDAVEVSIESASPLSAAQKSEIRTIIANCLRLNDDLDEFYRIAARHPGFRWIPKAGAGRLLRAQTVFEDVVKMICTTNCSWALTESMVGNLTTKLGESPGHGRFAFPTPQAIAATSESFLRKHIRAGYRSPYILEFATSVAEGTLDVESWRTSTLPTEDLFEQVKSVKGMGDYAAGNILKLIGRYDYLGLDSWVRSRYYQLHSRGRKVNDTTIEKHYASLGTWRGLFFWLEMTRYWYDEKFPF